MWDGRGEVERKNGRYQVRIKMSEEKMRKKRGNVLIDSVT